MIKIHKSIFILTFLTTLSARAQFHDYLTGLQNDLQIHKTTLADKLSQTTSVKELNFWDRFTSPTATALYSPLFNTIKLKEDLLLANGSIKNAQKIRGPRYQTTPVVTIFHEMGHAELDTLIENSSEMEDLAVMNLYKATLKNRYRQNFRGAKPYDIFHEHYAYYRTAVLEYLYNELSNIYMQNGYNYIQNRCYLTPKLKELLANGVLLEDFVKLYSFAPSPFYRKEIEQDYVFVKGKSYSLKEISDWGNIKGLVHTIFWSSLQKNYGFPINRRQFVERLNNAEHLRDFKECRKKLYKQSP